MVSFNPGCFTLWGTAPGAHWLGGWACPRVGLDAVEKRKILPQLEIELGLLLHQLNLEFNSGITVLRCTYRLLKFYYT
jgi:hypothetical protein